MTFDNSWYHTPLLSANRHGKFFIEPKLVLGWTLGPGLFLVAVDQARPDAVYCNLDTTHNSTACLFNLLYMEMHFSQIQMNTHST